MEPLDRYLSLAKEKGMDEAVVVATSRVHTAPWVKLKCQFGCHRYNNSLCCPPRTPAPDEMRIILDSYSRAILLHKLWPDGTTDIKSFNDTVVNIELALFFDGFYKAWAMGSGPCKRCEKCNVTGSCVHSSIARPSMEACGIDVFRTAADANIFFPVLRGREERRNSFGLVLVE